MSGWSIFALLLLLTPIALGLEIGMFISKHIIAVSIIFWLLQFAFAWLISTGEKDPAEKTASFMTPAMVFPSYCYLVFDALPQLEHISGFDVLIWPIEVSLSCLITFGAGLLVYVIAIRIKDPFASVALAILGEILVTAVLC